VGRLDELSGVPLYVQLRTMLEGKIESGELAAYAQLPTEEELARDYGIAVTTVRRALGDMVQRGLLYRKPGRGTFVRAREVPLRLRRSVSFSQDMRAKGMIPGARLISAAVVPADESLIAVLDVPAGTDLVRIVRLRTADGHPVLINDLRLLSQDCPGLDSCPELSSDQSSVYQILTRDYGFQIAEMKGFIQPVLASKQQAELLEIAPGSPIFRTEVTGTNPEGRPVVHAVDLVRGDWAFDISSG
jgi:GntR family transcriptional regulator